MRARVGSSPTFQRLATTDPAPAIWKARCRPSSPSPPADAPRPVSQAESTASSHPERSSAATSSAVRMPSSSPSGVGRPVGAGQGDAREQARVGTRRRPGPRTGRSPAAALRRGPAPGPSGSTRGRSSRGWPGAGTDASGPRWRTASSVALARRRTVTRPSGNCSSNESRTAGSRLARLASTRRRAGRPSRAAATAADRLGPGGGDTPGSPP